jgi:hypothetical protein
MAELRDDLVALCASKGDFGGEEAMVSGAVAEEVKSRRETFSSEANVSRVRFVSCSGGGLPPRVGLLDAACLGEGIGGSEAGEFSPEVSLCRDLSDCLLLRPNGSFRGLAGPIAGVRSPAGKFTWATTEEPPRGEADERSVMIFRAQGRPEIEFNSASQHVSSSQGRTRLFESNLDLAERPDSLGQPLLAGG